MIEIALFEPEIPPNTGNIIRLCANTGARLHLIHPLGFSMEEKQLRRAGLDYAALAAVQHHVSFDAFLATVTGHRIWSVSTRGQRSYTRANFAPSDVMLFGPETRGLPGSWLDLQQPDQVLRIPMKPGSRSLNLSNSVAILVYEAWRQLAFDGAVECS